MTNTDLIIELLQEIFPNGYCDSCLEKELDIHPHQQVNQISNRLSNNGHTLREIGICFLCKKEVKINISNQNLPLTLPRLKATVKDTVQIYGDVSQLSKVNQIDIEHLRNDVVRIILQLWEKCKKGKSPNGAARMINILKDEDFIPRHQANMMLTICNLRNVHLFNSIPIRQRESIIAENAWSIIEEWWQEKNGLN